MYTINGYLKVAPDQKVLTNKGYVEAQDLTYNEILLNVYLHEWEKNHKMTARNGSYSMYDFYIGTNNNHTSWLNVIADKVP